MVIRKIHVTKDEFDEFLYPAFATAASQGDQEQETAVRAARAFREAPTEFETISEDFARRMEQARQKAVPFLKLTTKQHTFGVEIDVYNLLLKRYKEHMKRITDALAIEKHDFLQKLESAEEVKLDGPTKAESGANAD